MLNVTKAHFSGIDGLLRCFRSDICVDCVVEPASFTVEFLTSFVNCFGGPIRIFVLSYKIVPL